MRVKVNYMRLFNLGLAKNKKWSIVWKFVNNTYVLRFISITKITEQSTLWFQIEDNVLLIGTFLSFDPVLFPIYEVWLLIGSILNFEALLGAPLIKNNLAPIVYTFVGVSFNWNVTFSMPWGVTINWNMSSNWNQRVKAIKGSGKYGNNFDF